MMRHLLKKADIIWVDLGELENVVGHEQAKTRPCVVIKEFNGAQLALVLPLTTTERSHYTIVKLDKSETGMDQDSYALCQQLRTISCERIKSKSGTISVRGFNRLKGVLIDILEL
jgi:mRNA interferase MazF